MPDTAPRETTGIETDPEIRKKYDLKFEINVRVYTYFDNDDEFIQMVGERIEGKIRRAIEAQIVDKGWPGLNTRVSPVELVEVTELES